MTDEPNTVYTPQPNQTAQPGSPPAGQPSPYSQGQSNQGAQTQSYGGQGGLTQPFGQPNPRDYPEVPKTGHIQTQEEIKKVDDEKPVKVDHLKEIAELVSGLADTSPSGANTIGSKIMYHVGALANPAEFDKAEAEKAKVDKKLAEQEAERTKKAKADQKKAAA